MATLKFGEKSPEVETLQHQLIKLGYNLKADGDFGANTQSAIHNFQKLNNVSPVSDEVSDDLKQKIELDLGYNAQVDKVSLDRINKLHPKIRFEVLHLLKQCYKAGVRIRVVQGYRTIAEQDELYAQGRTKPGPIVTNAKGGYSNHNYALSIDFCLLHSDGSISWSQVEDADKDGIKDWMEVVNIFKNAGYEAGIDWKFKDAPHLQKTFGYSIRQLLQLYTNGKVDKEGFIIL